MKGIPGLLLAVALGIVGAFCNWIYLAQKAREVERVDFVGIAENVKVNPGDKFSADHFAKISVPQNALGGLDRSAYKWEVRGTLIGMAATKSYSPGEIVLQQHMQTPPENDVKKLLAADERVLWIPVDTRTFVASLVTAGDQVSFIVPKLTGAPTPASDRSSSGGDRRPPGDSEIVGPFRILALGNRMGTPQVLRAAGITPSQENIMAVAVKIVDGQLDARGQQLSDLLRITNFQQVQVLLHPSAEAGKGTK